MCFPYFNIMKLLSINGYHMFGSLIIINRTMPYSETTTLDEDVEYLEENFSVMAGKEFRFARTNSLTLIDDVSILLTIPMAHYIAGHS